MNLNGAGIDVSKASLDVAVQGHPTLKRFENTTKGYRQSVRWLSRFKLDQVILEATGGYEQAALEYLHQAGLPVRRVNPRQARDFAKSTGQLAKTDALDAQVLAHMASVIELIPFQPQTQQQHAIQQLYRRRTQLKKMLAMEMQHRRLMDDPALRQALERHIKQLRQRLERLEVQLAQRTAGTVQAQVLAPIKGVGPVLLTAVIADLPELGTLDRKAIAKLVGVAPLAHDSGRRRGKRCIWGGRAQVRNTLYMATVSAVAYNPTISAFYASLRARGKPAKLAIVACMRKLLVIMNARLRDALDAQTNFA